MKTSAASAAAREARPSGAVLGAGVACALLFCLAARVPPLGLLAAVSPLPLTLTRLRAGTGGALASALLGATLLGTVLSPGHAITFLVVLAMPILVLAETVARGRGLRKGCLFAFAVLAAEAAAALLFAGPELGALLLEPLEYLRSPQFLADMRASGLPAERVTDWDEQFATLHRAVEIVYPAAYFIMAALVVLANTALLRFYLAWRDPGWLEDGEFERVRWPLAFAVLFVLAGAMIALPPVRAVGYNVLLVLAFFFALQGLAVVAYYAHRLAGPPLLRTAILLLVLVNPWAPEILALIGLFDTWFDFRRWAEVPPEAHA
ncbi:MAG TPA: DUF2232 domain-containing protein [Vicinamibacteria bacterium]